MAVSIKEYKERWNEHVSELTGLGWNLNPEKFKRLKEIQSELKNLIEVAAKDLEDRRKKEETAANTDLKKSVDYLTDVRDAFFADCNITEMWNKWVNGEGKKTITHLEQKYR